VHRGDATELQGLTAHAAPKTTIGFSTEYSDHSNEVTNKSYTTGFGYGTTGATGVYRITWMVPAAAPVGNAVVHLIASPGSVVSPSLTFRVAAPGAAC
jgi:protocatechuate 3,4-dioxygenase beta subunit